MRLRSLPLMRTLVPGDLAAGGVVVYPTKEGPNASAAARDSNCSHVAQRKWKRYACSI